MTIYINKRHKEDVQGDLKMDLSFYGVDLHIWLIHYGSFALFILLCLGIFGLPVPEETLMVIAGILMNKGDLVIWHTIIAAYLGSTCGITVSYLFGKTAGSAFIKKYGKWLHIKPEYLDQTQGWFTRFSKWALLVGYMIPGLRHFNGIFAGTAGMQFKEFALFAYSGALLWISIYLSIGYFWGHYWFSIYAALFQNIEMTMEILILIFTLVLIGYFIYKTKIKS